MTELSFIVPVYNRETHIEKFLEELLAINMPNMEVICVDDGSTDGTARLLDRTAEKSSKIKAYHIQNCGPGQARNFALRKAAGNYIAFCDSDDRIHTDVYKHMYEVVKRENKDLVLTNYREISDSGKVIERDYKFKDARDYWGILKHIALYGKIFRRAFIEKNRITFPDSYQGEDRVFLGKVVVAKPDFIWLDEISYDYLRHESDAAQTLTHSYSYSHFAQRMDCWKEFCRICEPVFPKETELHILHGMPFVYRMWCRLPQETKGSGLKAVKEMLTLSDHTGHLNWRIFDLPLQIFVKADSYEEYARLAIEENTKHAVKKRPAAGEPAVSVILPLYNAGKYLRQCLMSLCAQSYENFEMICVDDGSEDNTAEIVQEFMLFDKRVTLLTQKRALAGVARNYGLTKAKGKYCLFLDGDDFFEPEMVELSLKQIRRDDADICLFDARLYHEETKKTERVPYYLKQEFLPKEMPFAGRSFPYIFNLSTASPWNKLIRKALIEEYQIRFMPLPRCNDVYFIFLAMAVAKRITILNRVLVNYRQSVTSLQANNALSPYNWYAALLHLKKRLEELGIFPDVEQSFMNYALSLGIYNLFSVKSANVFCEFYNRAKHEMFPALGITKYDPEAFYAVNRDKYEKLKGVMRYSPQEYMFNDIKKLKEEKFRLINGARDARKKTAAAEKKLAELRQSETFRLGRFLLFLPRKIKKLLSKLLVKSS